MENESVESHANIWSSERKNRIRKKQTNREALEWKATIEIQARPETFWCFRFESNIAKWKYLREKFASTK